MPIKVSVVGMQGPRDSRQHQEKKITNEMPFEMSTSPTPDIFKSRLKTQLYSVVFKIVTELFWFCVLSNYFYSSIHLYLCLYLYIWDQHLKKTNKHSHKSRRII